MASVGRVVAGTSGSPGSLAALRYADLLACAHDAILVPVLAWEPPGGDRAVRFGAGGGLLEELRELAWEQLRAALTEVWGEVPDDARVRPRVERGPAGWVLVSVASRPGDLLIIGAGRRGTLRRAGGCQTGRYCAARARCPVILVPPADLARESSGGWLRWRLRYRVLTPARIVAEQRKPADR